MLNKVTCIEKLARGLGHLACLAVLKAAAEFCASRPELKSADLLALADRMEACVAR